MPSETDPTLAAWLKAVIDVERRMAALREERERLLRDAEEAGFDRRALARAGRAAAKDAVKAMLHDDAIAARYAEAAEAVETSKPRPVGDGRSIDAMLDRDGGPAMW